MVSTRPPNIRSGHFRRADLAFLSLNSASGFQSNIFVQHEIFKMWLALLRFISVWHTKIPAETPFSTRKPMTEPDYRIRNELSIQWQVDVSSIVVKHAHTNSDD